MQIITDRLSGLEIGQPTTYRNMDVYPLLGAKLGEASYMTLDDALAQGCAEITEVSDQGSVPELRFLNTGDKPILLLDGEELVGAKQNRVLNLTILAPANDAITIPVSCVESGRWNRKSRKFSTSSRAHYARGRARKMEQVSASMDLNRGRRSDQSEVWSDIDAKMSRLHSASPTSAMSDMYESHAEKLDGYVTHVSPSEGQVGAIFAIDGKIVGLELFDHSETLAKLLPKLVLSYALDAIEVADRAGDKSDKIGAQAILDLCVDAEVKRFDAIGEGEDLRLSSSKIAGAALVSDGQIVHLCGFASA